MRQCPRSPETDAQINPPVGVRTDPMADLSQRHFQQTLLHTVCQWLPAASGSVYRTGPLCELVTYMTPALTRRTTQLLACILQGLSFDDMALQMYPSINTANTANTYRNRAFKRHGIRFRKGLFALVLTSTQRVAAC